MKGKMHKKRSEPKVKWTDCILLFKILILWKQKNSFWKVTSKNTKMFFRGFYDHHEHTPHIIFSCLLIFFHVIIIIVEGCKEFFRINFNILISKTSFFHYSKRKKLFDLYGQLFLDKETNKIFGTFISHYNLYGCLHVNLNIHLF
jgi:hypothetical protein